MIYCRGCLAVWLKVHTHTSWSCRFLELWFATRLLTEFEITTELCFVAQTQFLCMCVNVLCVDFFFVGGEQGGQHMFICFPPNMSFLCVCAEQNVDKGLGVWRRCRGGEKGTMGDGWGTGRKDDGWESAGDGWLAGYVYRCEFVRAKVGVCGCVHTSAYLSACV